MATQVIEFAGPPGQTITLDVVNPSTDALEQTALTCTEATNAKGKYTTASFVDTLAGRFPIVKKISGVAINSPEYVTMVNADGTYKSDELKLIEAGVDSAVTASILSADIKAKTDLIGTIRSLIRW